MTAQRSLFDAAAARDEALERVDRAADPQWKDSARVAVYHCAMLKRYFTSEDVWRSGLEKPREPRALGPVLIRAVKAGWCVAEGYENCGMASRHKAPVRVYRSLLR